MRIEVTKLETREVEFSSGAQSLAPCLLGSATSEQRLSEFLKHILPKLDWQALCEAAVSVLACIPCLLSSPYAIASQEVLGLPGLPAVVAPNMLESETFLKALHHVLLEVHVEEGTLVCPESGHRFSIEQGIPNMLLDEDLVK